MNRKEWIKSFRERLLQFSVKIILLANELPKTSAGYAIANQICKCGTSIGANYEEAQDASSQKDFTQKTSISLHEARETYYWLQVILLSELIQDKKIRPLLNECNEIISIFVKAVKTSKEK